MTKLRAFLIGIIVGQLIMFPHILRWMKFPVVAAFPVSEAIYNEIGPSEHVIKDVRTNAVKKPTPMRIVLMTVEAVQAKYKEIYGETHDSLLGFYDYDKVKREHIIYCANSPEIVIHEIRHAFEGSYHRSE
jgi:hypothetical protein